MYRVYSCSIADSAHGLQRQLETRGMIKLFLKKKEGELVRRGGKEKEGAREVQEKIHVQGRNKVREREEALQKYCTTQCVAL